MAGTLWRTFGSVLRDARMENACLFARSSGNSTTAAGASSMEMGDRPHAVICVPAPLGGRSRYWSPASKSWRRQAAARGVSSESITPNRLGSLGRMSTYPG
jgi:hypothetical protein